jgi:hypothetical protein
LLAQAVAPLQTRSIRLSPSIALAGNLTTSQVASMQLPPMNVIDLVVLDEVGEVLALCVNLGEDSTGVLSDFTGVPSMVRSFLNRHHFACYVSDRIVNPAIAARWRANTIHAPIVGDVSIEMPVEPGSEETGEGIARVQVNLGGTLKDSEIKASIDNRFGDPLRLVSEQTIQLLRLWKPNGEELHDLGELGMPVTEQIVLSLQLFDPLPVNNQQSLNPLLESFLLALVLPIFVPILEEYAINDVSGFTSSAMRAIVVRWNLQNLLETTAVQPTGGVLAEP